MNKFIFILFLLIFSSCKNLDFINLYDIEVKKTEGINGFTSTEIFSKGGSDEVWGMKDEECNPFSFSSYDASIDYTKIDKKTTNEEDVNFEKVNQVIDLPTVRVKDRRRITKNSIHIKTDYNSNCEWIGMGIGWDGWQGKDLSNVMQNSAIQFMARVDGDPIFSLPIVFILEDYSENQCYATASYLGISGGSITQKWTKVTVPLPTFSYNINKLDLTNIKQLLLQCYDVTDVYLDEIKIVPHEHKYKKLTNDLTVHDTIFPVVIFEEELQSAYGVDNKYCDNIVITSNVNYSNGNYINVDINDSICDWKEMSISWNKWLYTDLSKYVNSTSLEFDLKIQNLENIKITFVDYNRNQMEIDIKNYLDQNNPSWQKIQIPLRDFPIRKSKIDLKIIKNIIFNFESNVKCKIDNLKLTNKI